MKEEYPRLHSITSVKGLLVETCEGMGTKEDPCHLGFYFALEDEDNKYRLYKLEEV